MDFSAELVQNLSELARDLGPGDDGVGPALSRLIRDLRIAVRSYAGLRLTVPEHDQRIVLTEFEEGGAPINTSLRIPLSALSALHDSPGVLILYAGTPGAFVDLAADLGYALSLPVRVPPDQNSTLKLDADLPASPSASGLSGLARYTTLNRATGILLDQGHLPEEIDAVLGRRAAAAGVDLHTYAAWVVASC